MVQPATADRHRHRRAVLPGRAAALVGRAAGRRGARSHLRRHDPALPAGAATTRFWTSACRTSSTTPPTCWNGNIRTRSASRRRAGRGRRIQGQPIRRSTYRRIEANRPLPFADKAFDIAVSNAVLEHVGSVPHQAAFVRELSPGGQTGLHQRAEPVLPGRASHRDPAAAFLDAKLRAGVPVARQGGLGGRAEFDFDVVAAPRRRWRPRGSPRSIGHTGIRLGPFSSNLFLFIDGGGPAVGRSGPGRGGVRNSHRRAIKSLRRKGSLLYEPRRRTDAAKRQFGGRVRAPCRAQPACREREGTPWARSSASTSAPPIPASQ